MNGTSPSEGFDKYSSFALGVAQSSKHEWGFTTLRNGMICFFASGVRYFWGVLANARTCRLHQTSRTIGILFSSAEIEVPPIGGWGKIAVAYTLALGSSMIMQAVDWLRRLRRSR